jgi:hypothetical protein
VNDQRGADMSSNRTQWPAVAGVEGRGEGLSDGAMVAEGPADGLAEGTLVCAGVVGGGGVGLGAGDAHEARRTVPASSVLSLRLMDLVLRGPASSAQSEPAWSAGLARVRHP